MRLGHRDITFLFSLCCSLLINTGMIGVMVLRAQPPSALDFSNWRAQPKPVKADEDEAFVPPPPEQPKPKIEFDPRDAFGETNAKGEALNSSPGEQPLQSIHGPQNQAFLGRNPPAAQGGAGGQTLIGQAGPQQAMTPRVKPIPPTPQPKQSVAQQKQSPPQQSQNQPQQAKTSPPSPPKTAQADVSQAIDPNQPKSTPPAPPATPAVAQASAPPPQQASAAPPQQASDAKPAQTAQAAPGAPGPRNPPAEPAPISDKDSDPFSDANSIKFVNGKVEARNGRLVKTVKPALGTAGWQDASFIGNPSVTFLAAIDETGNVIHVDLYRSSGSNNIDTPCREALNQWWIEPSKDKSGRPVKDVLSITFSFY